MTVLTYLNSSSQTLFRIYVIEVSIVNGLPNSVNTFYWTVRNSHYRHVNTVWEYGFLWNHLSGFWSMVFKTNTPVFHLNKEYFKSKTCHIRKFDGQTRSLKMRDFDASYAMTHLPILVSDFIVIATIKTIFHAQQLFLPR